MGDIAAKLIKGSLFRVLNLLLTIVTGLIIIPFIIRAVGDRYYGLWVLAACFIRYYAFLDFGLSAIIPRFVSKALGENDHDEVNRVFNTCLVLFLLVGLLTLMITALIHAATPYFVKDPADLNVFRLIIVLIGIEVSVSFFTRVFEGMLFAHVRFDILNSLVIAKLILKTLLIVFFLGRGFGLVALAAISLGTTALMSVVLVIAVLRLCPSLKIHLLYFERGRIRHLLGYSTFIFISNVADRFQFHFDAFVITAFLGLSYVTHYHIGSRIPIYYLMMITSAVALVVPAFSRLEGRNDYGRIREQYIFVSKLNAILSVFLGGSILIYGKAFIVSWMGADYLDSYAVCVVLVIGLIANTMQITSKNLLYSLSKHKVYAVVVASEGVVNILLSIALIGRYGILGVAMGTTIPMLVTNLFIIPVYTNRVIDLRLSIYAKTMLRCCALGAALHAVAWFVVRHRIENNFRSIIIMGIITSVVFMAVSVFALLSRAERRHFKIPV